MIMIWIYILSGLGFFFVICGSISVFIFRKEPLTIKQIFFLGSNVFRDLPSYVNERYLGFIRVCINVGITFWLLAVILIVIETLQ